MNRLILTGCLLLLLFAPNSRGANPGDEAVVIYNSRMPESRKVAEDYARRRQVPEKHIFGFDLSTTEEMSRAEFRDSLQRPLARVLEKNKLWHIEAVKTPGTNNQPGRVDWRVVRSDIRYAVLCYGVPLKIARDPTLVEEIAEKLRPEIRRNEAAVDSELALLPLVEQKLPLSGPLRNPIYPSTNSAWIHPTNGVLMVARLDGPTPEVAAGLVGKAMQAESEGLWGRAYIDLRNTTEPGYKMGDEWIRHAGEICRRLGFETVVDENPATFAAGFPMSHIAIYLGWYAENANGPFAEPTVEFMPGAFAYHLHSFSAVTLRSSTRGWVGPLLAKGATVTMGCVDEPYLSGTPDIGVFVSRLILYNFTFGEAAYACQPVLSWQTTVVGDPLYRPFGQSPEQLQDKLQQQHSPLVAWAYLRLLDSNLANGWPLANGVKLLEELEATKGSAVLTEKLGDLYFAQGKPSSATHAYEEALKLSPSPQQKLRLLLTLAENYSGANEDAEAFRTYQQLLEAFPDYPDKIDIQRKLLSLAQKLGRQAEIVKYEELVQRPAASTNSAH